MFSERLKRLRKDRGMTLDELAEQYNQRLGGGLNKGTISKYENGRQEPMMSVARNLARFFGVTVDYLVDEDETPAGSVVIPVLSSLCAESPYYAAEDMIGCEEIPARVASLGDHFALRLKDDSMMPQMKEGDTVIIRRQCDAAEGDVVAALIDGKEAVVRKLRKQENGGIMLVPFDPSCEPAYFSREERNAGRVRLVGRVVELRAKY